METAKLTRREKREFIRKEFKKQARAFYEYRKANPQYSLSDAVAAINTPAAPAPADVAPDESLPVEHAPQSTPPHSTPGSQAASVAAGGHHHYSSHPTSASEQPSLGESMQIEPESYDPYVWNSSTETSNEE